MNEASPISWSFKMQGIMALSSYEIEYIATSYATCQALWMEMLLEELKITKALKITLLVDKKSTIDLDNLPMSHGRRKYIERKYHFLRDRLNKNRLVVEYCKIEL